MGNVHSVESLMHVSIYIRTSMAIYNIFNKEIFFYNSQHVNGTDSSMLLIHLFHIDHSGNKGNVLSVWKNCNEIVFSGIVHDNTIKYIRDVYVYKGLSKCWCKYTSSYILRAYKKMFKKYLFITKGCQVMITWYLHNSTTIADSPILRSEKKIKFHNFNQMHQFTQEIVMCSRLNKKSYYLICKKQCY